MACAYGDALKSPWSAARTPPNVLKQACKEFTIPVCLMHHVRPVMFAYSLVLALFMLELRASHTTGTCTRNNGVRAGKGRSLKPIDGAAAAPSRPCTPCNVQPSTPATPTGGRIAADMAPAPVAAPIMVSTAEAAPSRERYPLQEALLDWMADSSVLAATVCSLASHMLSRTYTHTSV